MKNKKLFLVVFISFFVISLFTACSNVEESLVTPELTPSPVLDAPQTLVESSKDEVSATKTLMTETAEPTLLVENKIAWLKNLFEGTDGCDFPCVANHVFVVGETFFDEAVDNISIVYQEYPPIDNIDNGELVYGFEADILDNPYDSSLFLIKKDSKVFSAGFLFYSSLSDFLLHYGPPDEIWAWAIGVRTFSSTSSFEITLFYRSKGMLITFMGDMTKSLYINICESQLDTGKLSITLFDPSYTMENDFLSIMEKYSSHHYLPSSGGYPIEDISNIDVDNFYAMFTTPNPDNCFSLIDTDYYANPGSSTPISPSPTPIILD